MLLNEAELTIAKLVVTESHPSKGWMGITTLDPAGHLQLHGVFTRKDLYREVANLFRRHGAEAVRNEVAKRRVARSTQTIFIPYRDAFDYSHAERIIRAYVSDTAI